MIEVNNDHTALTGV